MWLQTHAVYSGGDQGRQTAVGVFTVACTTMAAASLHGCMTVEASDAGAQLKRLAAGECRGTG